MYEYDLSDSVVKSESGVARARVHLEAAKQNEVYVDDQSIQDADIDFGTRFKAGSELLVAGPAKERTFLCEIDCEQLKVLEWEYFGGTMKIAGSDTPAAITRLRGVDSGREFVAGKCKEG